MTTADDIENFVLNGPPYTDDQHPVVTVGEIAEALGVTKQTVRNNIDQAKQNPLVSEKEVGRSKVFWRSSRPEGGGVEDLENGDVQLLAEQERNLAVTSRAHWLHNAQILLDAESEIGGATAEQRATAWDALLQYLIQMHQAGFFSLKVAIHQLDIPAPYDGAELPVTPVDGELLPERSSLASTVLDVPLFNGAAGTEIRGLAMLYVYHCWLVEQVDGDPEAAGEYLPSVREINYAGQVLDRFAVRLVGFDW